jgi:cell division protein FtsB
MRTLESIGAVLYRNRGRIAILMLVLAWGYFLIAFGEQAWRSRQLQADVDGQRASIAALSRENARLQDQADRYASDAYIDYVQAVARRDLNLANPGETVLLVRWQDAGAPPSEDVPEIDVEDDRPNWQRWLDAFSGS